MLVTPERIADICRARDRLAVVEDDQPLRIAELARDAGMSTGLFIRAFAQVLGETPHQYRIRARMDRAKALLSRGDEVTSVCFDVGCSSLGSFSASFHRRVGVSPSSFRAERTERSVEARDREDAAGRDCFFLMTMAMAERR